jgi:hypothetical protein
VRNIRREGVWEGGKKQARKNKPSELPLQLSPVLLMSTHVVFRRAPSNHLLHSEEALLRGGMPLLLSIHRIPTKDLRPSLDLGEPSPRMTFLY